MAGKYDRPAQTTGNIVHFEHVNVTVPDPIIANIFWMMGMGFTRDPYLMVGVDNMWANIGMQQLHLPTRAPQVSTACSSPTRCSWRTLFGVRNTPAPISPSSGACS